MRPCDPAHKQRHDKQDAKAPAASDLRNIANDTTHAHAVDDAVARPVERLVMGSDGSLAVGATGVESGVTQTSPDSAAPQAMTLRQFFPGSSDADL